MKFQLHETYIDSNTNNCYYFISNVYRLNALLFADFYGYEIAFSKDYAEKFLFKQF